MSEPHQAIPTEEIADDGEQVPIHLAHEECFEIFRQLLQEGFLVLGSDDRYRLRSGIPHGTF